LTVGIILNFLSATAFSAALYPTGDPLHPNLIIDLQILALCFVIPLFISFAVLMDAFRRFRSYKPPGAIIDNWKVFVLLISFFVFAVGVTVVIAI
jgi:hypothetical protein